MAIEAVTEITTIHEIETVTESSFYIPMTGPAARPRRALKHDDTFIVLDSHGDIGASCADPTVAYMSFTRMHKRCAITW